MNPPTGTHRSTNLNNKDLFDLKAVNVPAYSASAHIYDHMMREVDYKRWGKYVLQLMRLGGRDFLPSKLKGKRICDLACGTGNISVKLSKVGLDVTGVDISEDMLQVARAKRSRNGGDRLRFIGHDMVSYRTAHPYDAAVCVYDSINYISSAALVQDFFHSVFSNLRPGGIFVFDASLESNSLGDTSLFKQRGKYRNTIYQRESAYDRSTKVHTTYVRVAIGGEVMEEIHREHVYPIGILRSLFERAGFVERFAAGDFTMSDADDTCDRVHFVLLKPNHD